MTVEVFGIRHHGPGSARALRRALEAYRPDLVLIEGPPEADPLLPLSADPTMSPPVALLAYTLAVPQRAAFWPFASFSPEWTALRYAHAHRLPARFIDLPAAHTLAAPPEDLRAEGDAEPRPAGRAGTRGAPDPNTADEEGTARAAEAASGEYVRADGTAGGERGTARAAEATSGEYVRADSPAGGERGTARAAGRTSGGRVQTGDAAESGGGTEPAAEAVTGTRAEAGGPAEADGLVERARRDPLGVLAETAGYDDAERWWDDVIELRGREDVFGAVAEAMGVLREGMERAASEREEQREAWMRQAVRKAVREGFERVAVVCGAWHVPALKAAVPAARDVATLKGLPKAKVAVTWVPWTHGRLAQDSGYGAGVRSPGWYRHLFQAGDRPVERWLTESARLLRGEGLPVSSAHVIEAVRLAEALAALRGRPLAGLDEVTEATLSVLCEGAEPPLELIRRRMVVGEELGSVPDSTPMVPLQQDLLAQRKRLRMKPSADPREDSFDLRKPVDLERSRLLHRLRVLDVAWGTPVTDRAGRTQGTFKETWTRVWHPEFDVRLIEAGVWGTTVRDAAAARLRAEAADARDLPELTALAERALLADLDEALPAVMGALSAHATADDDAVRLMAALPPLVRALRYGDVRGTPTGPLRTVVDGLVIRICLGLPRAAASLDDGAARDLLQRLDTVHETLALLDEPPHTARWLDALTSLADSPSLHGLLEGRLTRVLHDAGRLADLPARMSRAVSPGTPPARTAAWLEGLLSDGALLLIHDTALLTLLDSWLTALPPDAFTAVLPLLRRTFGSHTPPERRTLAARLHNLTAPAPLPAEDLDLARAAPAVTTVLSFLPTRP
ncbi:DUF5682 family protein [Actinocorallia aurantiaca]|uniref:Uncharacterized protein n=1 Tax=Actinocorallia aurantiaca TaxID=46204 RepID=A0ABN3UB14_9ACTN